LAPPAEDDDVTMPLLLLASLLPADASAPVDGPPSPSAVQVSDAGELQGEWEAVECFFGLREVSADVRGYRWSFTGPSAHFVDERGVPQFDLWEIRVSLYSGSPHIDGASDGRWRRGVYRRTGDELLWASSWAGQPSSFDPAPDVLLWTLRRVKK
jgi:hypothetical protein